MQKCNNVTLPIAGVIFGAAAAATSAVFKVSDRESSNLISF